MTPALYAHMNNKTIKMKKKTKKKYWYVSKENHVFRTRCI
jgi:hypothetical protein